MTAPPVEEILEELSPLPEGLLPEEGPRLKAVAPRLRWAVVGLGHFAQTSVLPAFSHVKGDHLLAALVTHDERKAEDLKAAYGVETVATYDGLPALLRSGTIDAVYLAVPNHLHATYAIEAAKAGVHVLCEKPMAVSRESCEAMIQTARAHHVRLMIAYRLHLDPANLEVIRRIRDGEIGDVRFFSAVFSFQLNDGNVRSADTEDGGGVVYDIGVYCINAARYVFGREPTSVVARLGRTQDPRFRDTEEQVAVILAFPEGGLASFVVSFGAADAASYVVGGTRGVLKLDPAFGQMATTLTASHEEGGEAHQEFAAVDQVAAEIAYFGECIREGREPEPSGREGLHDVVVIEAIRRSLETGLAQPIELEDLPGPRPSMARFMPPPVSPKVVVGVSDPHR